VSRGLPARFLHKYFQQMKDEWVITKEVRELVEFREINLAAPWPTLPPVDIIFLRNVLIYFDMDTRRSVLTRARAQLRPDGYLSLGGTEATTGIAPEMSSVMIGRSRWYRP
jgi:chemotaxis protein methyltransferase CheR